jgi:hypothetical protein
MNPSKRDIDFCLSSGKAKKNPENLVVPACPVGRYLSYWGLNIK